jgi:hypothetical protein
LPSSRQRGLQKVNGLRNSISFSEPLLGKTPLTSVTPACCRECGLELTVTLTGPLGARARLLSTDSVEAPRSSDKMGLNQQFLRKAPLKQRDPLPCLVVAELEKLLLRQEDNVQTCILGQLLWCFHAASRWSHSMRSQSLRLEKIKRHCLGNRRSAAGVQDFSDKRSSNSAIALCSDWHWAGWPPFGPNGGWTQELKN